MRNAIGREVIDNPFAGAFARQRFNRQVNTKQVEPVVMHGIENAVKAVKLEDGMTISFHHHLRNGDFVLDMTMRQILAAGMKDLKVAASSIFPAHKILVDCIDQGVVTSIDTAYISGPVAEAVSAGRLKGDIRILTHGGRARAILEGECPIDVAFIAAPAVDRSGQISGVLGNAACGSLGYAVADAWRAKTVVAVTDHLVESDLLAPDIEAGTVDIICVVDKIGDAAGIVSGTTRVTKDPVGLKIAKDATDIIVHSGLFQNGFSFQTGAGGVSLAVAEYVRDHMRRAGIVGAFGCGGITSAFTGMLEEGLFHQLFDVQAFDLAAVESSGKQQNHHRISASYYANPNEEGHVASRLDVVVLGASEIDLDFNVNVTTGSNGALLGGSGGHADTAAGAKISLIVSKLVHARVSCIHEKVTTVTTPGETVDVLVTDRGVAVNPKRKDLEERLSSVAGVEIVSIDTLFERALALTGQPATIELSGDVIGRSVYRDGTELDKIYRI